MILKLLRSKKLTSIQLMVIGAMFLVALVPFTKDISPMLNHSTTKVDAQMTMKKPVIKIDNRTKVLKNYLAKHDSPLVDSADDFVKAADANNVDWKLVPSIAGVESTFGKFIPGGHDPKTISYNGWGWGVYGDQSLAFKSWNDAITTITSSLKTNYIDRGLTTPTEMNRVYAASPVWGTHVNYFMNDLDRYAQTHGSDVVVELPGLDVLSSVAGTSALINLNPRKLAFAH